ncbi:hypothetical protein IF1G_00769 [Cordyceps javanica]|uniref:Uncharacterized protein n=1 Tax=Cordyceps javanica TaxID=43265 RepID=A0A545VGI3_9HYPO|nr:hypothetical protein IF1G_00769 [Cordyceps javanica]TQW12014.1 hypothetical protein IF2G_00745 [Cordyceps javanica]
MLPLRRSSVSAQRLQRCVNGYVSGLRSFQRWAFIPSPSCLWFAAFPSCPTARGPGRQAVGARLPSAGL